MFGVKLRIREDERLDTLLTRSFERIDDGLRDGKGIRIRDNHRRSVLKRSGEGLTGGAKSVPEPMTRNFVDCAGRQARLE